MRVSTAEFNTKIKFSRNDCWILFSVPNNQGGGNLSDIIGLSDTLTNTIPAEHDMRIALTKAVQAGLLHYEKGRFYPSEMLWGIKDQIIDSVKGFLNLVETLYETIGANNYDRISDQQVNFFTGEYELACSLYSDMYWAGNYQFSNTN